MLAYIPNLGVRLWNGQWRKVPDCFSANDS